ncbi:hypothetical protein GNE08_06450 [Trichormus variabilis ARAD]|uniref:Uncharacterized protein n=1 Tax=Trichormus variabilis N2B TaxID=2681315 RepID=A0ABR6S4V1_ANAVA|nr:MULTISPECIES: hypothetical protein [Nostocaceae]MBD2379476.1 hypothetical protein [Trichormus variabilis FACHB-319]MBC1213861.1 hypothetical protein [Trichormus variabilis ARAD]MBC1254359.1 hypothetical protein [Trichormus variabilis V5]MBC1265741.1 hypothetical protein [Trichormus variabilis FSR]MBC1301387.1 hypothetical protein [Trichormus variabilis N2B]
MKTYAGYILSMGFYRLDCHFSSLVFCTDGRSPPHCQVSFLRHAARSLESDALFAHDKR